MKITSKKVAFTLFVFLFMTATAMAQRNFFTKENTTLTSSEPEYRPRLYGYIENLLDGKDYTRAFWNNIPEGQLVITAEMKTATKLIEFLVVNKDVYSDYNPKEIVVSGSNDNLTWTLLKASSFSGTEERMSIVTDNETAYKYYKFDLNGLQSFCELDDIYGFSGEIFPPVTTATPAEVGDKANVSWTQELYFSGIYELERSTDRVNFSLIDSFDYDIVNYEDTGLTRNTAYWYRVRGKKDGQYFPYSNVAEVITADDVIREEPYFYASASSTNSSMASMNWYLEIGGPGTFELERSLNGTDFELVSIFDKEVSNYTDTGLVHNTDYWYRLRAKNEVSTSPYSDTIMITTLNDALVNAPALDVTAPTGTQAVLSWELDFSTEGGFELEKSTDGTNFSLMGITDKSVTSYTEESLTPNTSYWYRVRAYNYVGKSPYSEIVMVTTNSITSVSQDITDDGGVLAVSDDNTGGPEAGEGSSKLLDNSVGTKWLVFYDDVSSPERTLSATYQPTGSYVVTGYSLTTANDAAHRDPKDWRFEGSDDNLTWTLLDTRTNQLGSAVNRYTTVNYQISDPGTYKFYRITFTENNESYDGVLFQIAEWQIFGLDPESPNIPANLAVSGTTTNSISLKWEQDVSIPVKNLVLQRSTDNFSYHLVDTLAGTATSYTDDNLYDGSTYYYRLRALGNSATAASGWSNVASGTTLTTAGIPLIPSDLTASNIKETKVTLQWNDRSDDETGFLLERSRDNVTFESVNTVAANTNVYTDDTLWPGQYFYYRVSALKDKAKSGYSNVVKVLTKGINTAPTASVPILPKKLCTGAGEYSLAFNGITVGPAFESIQKLSVTGVKAADEESEKFFSSYSFNPVVTEGIVNFKVTTTGMAVPGDSALVAVTVKDDGGTIGFASDSTEFLVKIYFTPLTIKIVSDKGTENISRYAVVNLTAQSNFPENTSFEWAEADGIKGARDGIKLRVEPVHTTTYTLTAKTPTGCVATASITLKPQDSLVISNVITPNNDGKNDHWVIWGIEKVADNEVKVTDRRGRLVFAKKNYNNDWDGTYNGDVLPQGGYYYVIETNDGNKPQTGVLMIVK